MTENQNPEAGLVAGAPEMTLSPGAQLKAARERAGWTPERMAAELCLPVARLHALEADDHASFGGVVFVRGYLRRAASLLGLSAAELIAAFEACCDGAKPTEILPGLAPGNPPSRGAAGWAPPLAGGLVVLAALGASWWFFGTGDQGTPAALHGSDRSPPALEFMVAADEPAAPLVAPTIDTHVERSEAGIEPGVAPGQALRAETGEADASAGRIPQAPGAAADETSGPRVVELAEPAPPPPGTVELRFEFSEDCWVEVSDAEERRLAYRLYRAGEVARMRGTAPVSVFLGNAEGVRLTVDDAQIAVRPAARRDGTARLTVGGGAG